MKFRTSNDEFGNICYIFNANGKYKVDCRTRILRTKKFVFLFPNGIQKQGHGKR